MSERRMFRYVVPVDDQAHEFTMTGDPVAVAARSAGEVEFWAEHDSGREGRERAFRVFGTGQPLPPPPARWVGTCNRVSGLVWHLLEIPVGGCTCPDDCDLEH